MILADRQIKRIQKKHGLITPFKEENLQPNSVDLTLSDQFYRETGKNIDVEDYKPDGDLFRTNIVELQPHSFLLASTEETIKIPSLLVGRVEGKSSLGRLGVIVHATAGFIDTGFEGQVTLEIANLSNNIIRLHAGMKICQIVFEEGFRPENMYAGRYQKQLGVTPSRVSDNL